MKIVLFIIFIFLFNYTSGQALVKKGIQFRSLTFEQALSASKLEGKPVFMHGYASWCHYCMYMADSVYSDSTVGAFYNELFISIKVDLEKEGAELNKRLKSHTFPTLLFFDANGGVIHRAAGRYYKSMFLEVGKEAIDPRRQLRSWINIYNGGNVSADTAFQVIRKMEVAGMETQESLLKYLNRLKPEEISKPQNWRIINELFKDVDSPFMQSLIEKKTELENLYTKKAVNNKFFAIYTFELFMRNRLLDSAGYDALKQKVKASKLDIGNMICDYADLNKLKAASQYINYFEAAQHFVRLYCMDNPAMLYEVSQVFYEKTKDSLLLSGAAQWMKTCILLEDTYNYNVLLCGLLIQLHNKTAAKTVADHAMNLASQKGINNRMVLLMLDKIDELQ